MPPADADQAYVDADDLAAFALRLLEVDSPPGHEREIASAIVDELRRRGVTDVHLDEVFDDSPSVIARISGAADGPVLQWHGHLDAIATPHERPYRDGDLLIGRGASDMKGALAAMVATAGVIASRGLITRGSLLLTFHGLHEQGGNAPLIDLIARGIHGDAAIIGELGCADALITASPGLTFWEIILDTGVAPVHETLRDRTAASALDACLAIAGALSDYDTVLQQRGASVYVGSASAGDYHNRVPASGILRGTLRHRHDTNLASMHREFREVVAAATPPGINVEVHAHGLAEAYSISADATIARALRCAVFDLTGQRMRQLSSQAVGNAHHFADLAGIPAVYYGCDYETAHSDREVASITQILELTQIYLHTTLRFLDASTDDVPELALHLQ